MAKSKTDDSQTSSPSEAEKKPVDELTERLTEADRVKSLERLVGGAGRLLGAAGQPLLRHFVLKDYTVSAAECAVESFRQNGFFEADGEFFGDRPPEEKPEE